MSESAVVVVLCAFCFGIIPQIVMLAYQMSYIKFINLSFENVDQATVD